MRAKWKPVSIVKSEASFRSTSLPDVSERGNASTFHKPLRVCMLNDNFYRGSGVTHVIHRLARSSSFKDVELYLAGCNYLSGKEAFVEDVDIVPPDRYRSFALMGKNPRMIPDTYKLANWLIATRCDVVHVHHRRLAVLANALAPFTGVPVLFTGHLTFPHSAWFQAFAPSHMTGVSPSVVEYLRRTTRATNVDLVYNPHHFVERTALPSHVPPLRVLCVGRLDPVKGHSTLIEAWALLRKTGISARLDIFGEGSLRDSLQRLIVSHGLEDTVRLCGFADDLTQRMQAYSFCVLASEKEGFPNAVVEAASYGMPTLLTDVDGSRDTIPPDLALPNGVPFGDPIELSRALKRWCESPHLINNDGSRFHNYLKALCSPEAVGRNYLSLYSKLRRSSRG